jgi:hypothetical protein
MSDNDEDDEDDVFEDIGGLINTLRARIAALEAENARLREASAWVPVGERLPTDGMDVLILTEYAVKIAYWHKGLWYQDDGRCWDIAHASHWRELPSVSEPAP